MLKRIMIACVLGFVSIMAMEKEQYITDVYQDNQQKEMVFIAAERAIPQLKDILSGVVKDLAEKGIKVSWITEMPTERDRASKYVHVEFMDGRPSQRIMYDRTSDARVLIKNGALTFGEDLSKEFIFCSAKSDFAVGTVTLVESNKCLDKLMAKFPLLGRNEGVQQEASKSQIAPVQALQEKNVLFIAAVSAMPQLKDMLSGVVKDLAEKGIKVSWITEMPTQLDRTTKYVRVEFMAGRPSQQIMADTTSDARVLIKTGNLTSGEDISKEFIFCPTKIDWNAPTTNKIKLIEANKCLDKLMTKLI